MLPPRRLTVILNPSSSGGRGARLQAAVETGLESRGIPHTLHRTRGAGHAENLAAEARASGADMVMVVGGDGTIHEVANGLLKGGPSPPPIAVIPVGTGNDFYRMIAHSRKPEVTLDALLHGTVEAFDVGRVRFGREEAYFVNLLGVGVDVDVLRKRVEFSRLKGLPQYLAAFASVIFTFRPSSYRVALEVADKGTGSEILEDRSILTAFTVGPSVGGGFLINPGASPRDGRLDLFFVRTLGILKLARYIPGIIKGTLEGAPELVRRRVRSGRVRRTDGESFHFEVDGELINVAVNVLDIAVCPGLLPVLLPGAPR